MAGRRSGNDVEWTGCTRRTGTPYRSVCRGAVLAPAGGGEDPAHRRRRPGWPACDIAGHSDVPRPHKLIDENRDRCRDLSQAVVQTTGVGQAVGGGGEMSDDVADVVFVPVVEI